MEQISEEYIIKQKEFIKEYYNDFLSIENNLNNKIKLFRCNFTGDKINILSNEKYIKYSDGHIYKWDVFVEYIDYLYSIYDTINIRVVNNESKYLLNISYNKKNIILEFCKNFNVSFHKFIDNPYHIDLTKFLIYPIYKG